ncbi:MAG: DUF6166 domain-containing protein [Pseudomonadota bacterium]
MKTYMGDRTIDGIVVTVDGKPLDERRDVQTFSEDGFEWGFEGPAAAQLALALLADHLDDGGEAVRLHEAFMREIVANFANEWQMTSADMAEAVDALRS